MNRTKELHRFGETVVYENLTKKGWHNCNIIPGLSGCFHIEAYKDGQKYLFNVDTRSHMTHKGTLKTDYYNLFFKRKGEGGDTYARVRTCLTIAHEQNAIPMWAAVRVDVIRKKYDIYYGRVAKLEDQRKIPMSPSDRLTHDKLAQGIFDERIDSAWSNVKKKRVA